MAYVPVTVPCDEAVAEHPGSGAKAGAGVGAGAGMTLEGVRTRAGPPSTSESTCAGVFVIRQQQASKREILLLHGVTTGLTC